jgi:Domain of unknown function (DUF4261)
VPLLLTDLLATELHYKTKLDLFHNALQSTLAVAPCQAIHWAPSQQVVNPLDYLDARRSDDFHPLQYALNARYFRITDGQQGDAVMDTMGLNAFGLPDLQCHYRGLEPNAVARVLYDAAYYIFDQGNIIRDGETIQGIQNMDQWVCRHEMALVGPARVVLDLDPGEPYAAGHG